MMIDGRHFATICSNGGFGGDRANQSDAYYALRRLSQLDSG